MTTNIETEKRTTTRNDSGQNSAAFTEENNMAQQNQSLQSNSNSVRDFFMRLGVLGELLAFLWKRKLYWLLPMMIALIVIAVLIALGSSGAGGIFIYTLW